MSKLGYKHTIFASYGGYITQAVVNNLAPLLFTVFRRELGLSLEKITFLVTVNFAVQLLVDLASTKFVDKIGYKPCIISAHIFCALGLAGMGIFPYIGSNAYAGLMCAVLIYAVGGGLIEVL
ncbi:MAG: MFS transporter, partial [Eubacterium sp.]